MKYMFPPRGLLIRLQVRYHHDGKYNVMHLDGPIEIYGESRNSFNSNPSFAARLID